jgi:hypothetical protein
VYRFPAVLIVALFLGDRGFRSERRGGAGTTFLIICVSLLPVLGCRNVLLLAEQHALQPSLCINHALGILHRIVYDSSRESACGNTGKH